MLAIMAWYFSNSVFFFRVTLNDSRCMFSWAPSSRSCSSFIILILLLESFSHQRYLMVFHGSLSDSKSPQVSNTIVSILGDLNNALLVLLFPSPPGFVPIIWWLYQEHQSQLALLSLSYSTVFFDYPARSMYLSLFSHSFNFTIHNSASSFFFVDYYTIWSSGWN